MNLWRSSNTFKVPGYNLYSLQLTPCTVAASSSQKRCVGDVLKQPEPCAIVRHGEPNFWVGKTSSKLVVVAGHNHMGSDQV